MLQHSSLSMPSFVSGVNLCLPPELQQQADHCVFYLWFFPACLYQMPGRVAP